MVISSRPWPLLSSMASVGSEARPSTRLGHHVDIAVYPLDRSRLDHEFFFVFPPAVT